MKIKPPKQTTAPGLHLSHEWWWKYGEMRAGCEQGEVLRPLVQHAESARWSCAAHKRWAAC